MRPLASQQAAAAAALAVTLLLSMLRVVRRGDLCTKRCAGRAAVLGISAHSAAAAAAGGAAYGVLVQDMLAVGGRVWASCAGGKPCGGLAAAGAVFGTAACAEGRGSWEGTEARLTGAVSVVSPVVGWLPLLVGLALRHVRSLPGCGSWEGTATGLTCVGGPRCSLRTRCFISCVLQHMCALQPNVCACRIMIMIMIMPHHDHVGPEGLGCPRHEAWCVRMVCSPSWTGSALLSFELMYLPQLFAFCHIL
jgi:hypothetical protein